MPRSLFLLGKCRPACYFSKGLDMQNAESSPVPDGREWLEYEFHYKPGDVARGCILTSSHHHHPIPFHSDLDTFLIEVMRIPESLKKVGLIGSCPPIYTAKLDTWEVSLTPFGPIYPLCLVCLHEPGPMEWEPGGRQAGWGFRQRSRSDPPFVDEVPQPSPSIF